MCWLLYTNFENKTQYRRAALFAKSQKKSQHKYVSKSLYGLETLPDINRLGGGGINKHIIGRILYLIGRILIAV